MTFFIHTSTGKASVFPNPNSAAQEATFGPIPFTVIRFAISSSVGSARSDSRSSLPSATFAAASYM